MRQHYTTVNMLRTITDLLGLDHLGMLDAHQRPMSEVFDLGEPSWSFTAKPSGLLAGTKLPIDPSVFTAALTPTHDSFYWAAKTAGMDFSAEDRIDARRYNRILWEGLMVGKAYPSVRTLRTSTAFIGTRAVVHGSSRRHRAAASSPHDSSKGTPEGDGFVGPLLRFRQQSSPRPTSAVEGVQVDAFPCTPKKS